MLPDELKDGYLPFQLEIDLPPSMYLIEHDKKNEQQRHDD